MKVKFVLLGGQNAGKTSILRRYFDGKFYADSRMPTIGADVYSTITTTRSSSLPTTTENSEAEKEGEEKQLAQNTERQTAENSEKVRGGIGVAVM